MAQEVIWQGSSSFSTGQTPWGLYDSDSDFSSDVDKFADDAIKKQTISEFGQAVCLCRSEL